MMFIITDREPKNAVSYLINNTNKSFCLTQLRELCQLICSSGISNVYKPIKQGKGIQNWIKLHPKWTLEFFKCLKEHIENTCNLSNDFKYKLNKIQTDLENYPISDEMFLTAIFRYKEGYKSDYSTNSSLSVGIVENEYKKYLSWKFKHEN